MKKEKTHKTRTMEYSNIKRRMVDEVFIPNFVNVLKSDKNTDINNIDKDLLELLIAGVFTLENKHLIWIVGENENLLGKKEKLKLWIQFLRVQDWSINFYLKPFDDPYINNQKDIYTISQKIELLSSFLNRKRCVVITTRSALSIRIEARRKISDFFFEIVVGKNLNRGELIKKLVSLGYSARNIVEDRGDFAWRGSVVDGFPINNNGPIRIEIENDIVISMRRFNPDTQKSIEKINKIVFPLANFFLQYKETNDYLNNEKKELIYLTDLLKDYKIVLSDKRKINDEFSKLMSNYEKIYLIAGEKKKNYSYLKKTREIFDFPLENENVLSVNDTFDDINSPVELIKLKYTVADLNESDIEVIKGKTKKNDYTLFTCSENEKTALNLEPYLGNNQFHPYAIPFSFENPHTSSIFLAEKPIIFTEKFDKAKDFIGTRSENLVKEIRINDLVVHKIHGIGRFIGFKKLNIEGNITEFLKIEFLKKEYLYVPVYELDGLSKYVSWEGYNPNLDKMGGNSWRLKQNRAKKSIIVFAKELLQLYALRKSIRGRSYERDPEMEDRLDQGFKYVETEDQKRAIKDVLADLELKYPMDRLICGDVSFGKTEVAIRAALRVVTGGKQVVMLCPTTILAYQHYTTFKNRFEKFPVNIAMLSRMVPAKEKKSIIKGIADGHIDIVIGTHSVLSKNLAFKRLGLYIIDEEQRFGVFQKERLKQNREDMDAISLSATPIPRTLSLSLAGLQDISTIQSPPLGRIAIKNYVGWFSKEILVSAILKEIDRDGLVFLVYNNIDKIYTFQEDLRRWLPEIDSTVIHARMKSVSIENNLMSFIGKKIRVLISTSIIENGIDIPDVNTLIVLDADRFGLTQLYQLRGRIGRGNRQAYAYFLIRRGDISDRARARLEAIREFADLGSGFKLAEFDLKLRGAGSLLGNKQHGHIEALGFDYYHQLLNRTIKELKGELGKEKETRIHINFPYSIDPLYIQNSTERIGFYRRILEVEEFEQIEELRRELSDRYGRLPNNIEKIFLAGMVRILAKKCSFQEVDLYLDKVIILFSEKTVRDELVDEKYLLKFKPLNIEILDSKTCAFYFKDYSRFIEKFRAILKL